MFWQPLIFHIFISLESLKHFFFGRSQYNIYNNNKQASKQHIFEYILYINKFSALL